MQHKQRHHFAPRFFTLALLLAACMLLSSGHAHAAPSISITSPAAGASLPANSPVTITGTATANTTIVIKKAGKVLATTISDGAGAWSVSVSDLGTGDQSLTAYAVQNGTYAYFGTAGASNAYHRLRVSDYALNPGGGAWPVTTTILPILTIKNKLGQFYFSDIGAPQAPAKFTLSAPADPVAATGLSPTVNPQAGGFNPTGTKYYFGDLDSGDIVVLDTATNTQLTTIPAGGNVQSVATGPNGYMYAANITTNTILVIDPTTDTVVNTLNPGCPSPNSVGILIDYSKDYVWQSQAFDDAPDTYLVTCAGDGVINKFRVSDNALLASWDISATLPTISSVIQSLDKTKYYVSATIFAPGSNKIAVVDAATGTVTATIPITAETLSAIPSPDGQYLFVSTPGTSFNTLNIDVISLETDTVVQSIDTSAFGVPGVVQFDNPEIASQTLSLRIAASSSASLANTGRSWYLPLLGVLTTLGIGLGALAYMRKQS